MMKRVVQVGLLAGIGSCLVGACSVDRHTGQGEGGGGSGGAAGGSTAGRGGTTQAGSGGKSLNGGAGGGATTSGGMGTSGGRDTTQAGTGSGGEWGGAGSENTGGEAGSANGGSSNGGSNNGGSVNGGTNSGGRSTTGGVGGGTGGNLSGGSGGAPGLARGSACTVNGQCLSGFCNDGVCCESVCSGACKACSLAKTGQPDGTCAGISANSDPDNECTKGSTTCGLDGMCDGAGACRFAAPSVVCGTESCTGGKYTAAAKCDGAGNCATPTPLTCANCAGTACNVACTASTQCPTSFYCATSVCAAKKANGSTCTLAEECANNSCVEGVCCDGACNTKCSSCLQANTGQTDGKCAPVKVGVAHASDCTASAASTCGLDGKCDGAGACRKHVSGTQCVAASCASGTATKSAARTCDGNGTCSTVSTSSCGNYLCDSANATCKASCTVATASADCGASAYCSNGACAAKKAAGALCSTAGECSSGTCSGRCCKAGEACTCTQPSSANLLKNPGFDTDLSGWTQESGPGGFSWMANSPVDLNGNYGDFESCPFSGSAFISSPANTTQRLWQCVTISPGVAYNFGARIHTAGGAYAYCDVDTYPGANCSGTPTTVASVSWINVAWGPGGNTPQTFTSGLASSARVSCYLATDWDAAFYADHIYLSKSPGQY